MVSASSKSRKEAEKNELQSLAERLLSFTKPVASFNEIPLSKKTLEGLTNAYYTVPSPIQSATLPLTLKGKDVLAAATTGSGKTLAFLIPILERLLALNWGPTSGLGALIISPTRELALQIFTVLTKIGKFHLFSAGLIIGGKSLKEEQVRLSRMNILVCTPGRLLQHMDQTIGFQTEHLEILVLDEADRILDLGFSASLNAILKNLPKKRQTMLFSATQTKSIKDLARLSLDSPAYISTNPSLPASKLGSTSGSKDVVHLATTPKNLEQHYMIVPLDQKLSTLWSFIKTHLFTKAIIFLSSGKQVRFIYENFRHLRPGIPLLHMHGKQKQTQRLEIYQKFSSAKFSILFATDIAARGLDFPSIDWVLQVDCPEDVETYIHRVGRTARYEKKGKALLFLCPSEEEGMVKRLADKKIELGLIKANGKKLQTVTSQLQSAAFQFPEIKFLAQRAFISYSKSLHLQKDKTIFKFSEYPLEKFSESLGLVGVPRIKLIGKGEASDKKNAVKDLPQVEESEASEGESGSGSDDELEGEKADESASAAEEEEEDEEEEEEIESEVAEEVELESEAEVPIKSTGVKTKYDRMFARKSQTVLSKHYTDLIADGSDSDSESQPFGGAVDPTEDLITLKRKDHTLDGVELPSSSYLSKRALKMGTSKKALLASRPNATKLLFDEEGTSREIYSLIGEKEFLEDGDATEQKLAFLAREGEIMEGVDTGDKKREKEKRREKKRKGIREGEEQPIDGTLSGEDDDGYVSPTFDLSDHSSDEDEGKTFNPTPVVTKISESSGRKNKKRRIDREEVGLKEVDLEALALKALHKE